MTEASPDSGGARPLRLWPALVLVVLMWLGAFGSGAIAPGTPVQFFGMFLGPIVGLLLLAVWWLFFSRAPWRERLVGFFLVDIGLAAAFLLAHSSARGAIVVRGIPFLSLGIVAWLLWSRRYDVRTRRLGAIAVIAVACLGWAFVRTEGVDGSMGADYAWRWSSTAEERFLASDLARVEPQPAAVGAPIEPPVAQAEWPGFRGPRRDGRVEGLTIDTAWQNTPPEEIWRRPIGPGWSSFSVAGDRLYTQEQRGEEEIVACYEASSGEPLWLHRNPARFWEALAGAGPRATPTYHEGRIFAVGATGIVDCLDAVDGRPVWSRSLTADTGAEVPDWGFASSPLIVDDLVLVWAGGEDGKAMVAYDASSGEPRWFAPTGLISYSSPHLATIDGMRQVLILTDAGASSLDPADGSVLWEYSWPLEGMARIVQPVVTDEGQVLIGTGFGKGVRSLDVSLDDGSWAVTEGWLSRGLKPYYNDMVVHRGHLYGFDGSILACIDAATGERKWKRGRYGHGQVLMIADQDLALVLSEKGEVVLVAADPGEFREIARIPAIEGKTWNHPVLVGDRLYVRNGEEAAAFRLSSTSRTARSDRAQHSRR